MTQQEINDVLQVPYFQEIIGSEEFFFQKGKEALEKWINMEVSEQMKEDLIRLSSDYTQFMEIAEINPDIEQIRNLLLEVISYCDNKAKDKAKYNQYQDARTLAKASVRMGNWVEGLIRFKFRPDDVSAQSIINAFNYLLEPQNNATVLSKNHRQMVCLNLFNKDYVPENFINDLKDYFSGYQLSVQNQENYTYLLSSLVYAFKQEWIEEVVGLMASDGTGWQEGELNLKGDYEGFIIWNSKKPSGGDKTLKFLSAKLKDGETFPIYYSSKGNVQYKANIIDFAISAEEYINKDWSQRKIKHYSPKFSDYHDVNKSAYIVFFAESMERVEPIKVDHFKFFGSYKPPTQDNLAPLKETPDLEIVNSPGEQRNKSPKKHSSPMPLNQILFGPPGTGKTYHSINKALEIINDVEVKRLDWTNRKQVKEVFNKKMEEGRIVFTTFHQSMSYEEFIEGIKPQEPDMEGENISFKVIPGIFKKLCQDAATPNKNNFDDAYRLMLEELSAKENLLELKTPTGKDFAISVNSKGNLSLHTGKDRIKQGTLTKENIQKQITGEDKFVGWEGYFLGVLDCLDSKFGYQRENEVSNLPYVLIIDEINRGNISQIFGELITLIEDDKRLGNDEALEVTLPYSKEKFGVPPNLNIIGTMNTADRSVEALDTALRRRFSFVEMPPLYDLEGLKYQFAGTTGSQILQMINLRIEKLLDRDHLIGHSYFLLNNGADPEERLMDAFYKNIIPLLQEYFFGDYAKIGAVLGRGFVRVKHGINNKKTDVFAEFDGFEADDFNEKMVFEIIDYRDHRVSHAITKKGRTIEMNFQKAIQELMSSLTAEDHEA